MLRSLPVIILVAIIAGCSFYNRSEPVQVAPRASVGKTIAPGFYRVAEDISMFESADLGSRRLMRVEAGTILEVIDAAGAFAQVKFSDNAGWLHIDEVEDTGAPSLVRTLGRAGLRESTDPMSRDIEILDSGRLLTVKKRYGDWILVKVSENRGWILIAALDSIGIPGAKSDPGEHGYWRVIKKSNLRASPAIASEVLRLVPAGSTVKYFGSEGNWVHIEFDGTMGYIHEDLVRPY